MTFWSFAGPGAVSPSGVRGRAPRRKFGLLTASRSDFYEETPGQPQRPDPRTSVWNRLDKACAHRTWIFGTGTISCFGPAPGYFPGFLHARIPCHKVSCATRRHLVSPRSGRKFGRLRRKHVLHAKTQAGGSPEEPSIKVARPEKVPGGALTTFQVWTCCKTGTDETARSQTCSTR